ncbi:hypothetical protein Tco_0929149 [Tanacetum coccineum]
MRKLLHDQGNLHERVEKLRMELDTVQKALDSNPADLILREEEGAYVQAFNEVKLDEERFLKQKAKVEWLDVMIFATRFVTSSPMGRFLRRLITHS